MKKVFLMFAVFGIIALTSCTKLNTCECNGIVVAEYDGLNNEQRDEAKSSCELSGCDWN